MLARTLNFLQAIQNPSRVLYLGLGHRGHAQDHVHGRAQVVGQVGNKPALILYFALQGRLAPERGPERALLLADRLGDLNRRIVFRGGQKGQEIGRRMLVPEQRAGGERRPSGPEKGTPARYEMY